MVIAGALLTINAGYDPDVVTATVEYCVLYVGTDEKHIETFETVRVPILRFLRETGLVH